MTCNLIAFRWRIGFNPEILATCKAKFSEYYYQVQMELINVLIGYEARRHSISENV